MTVLAYEVIDEPNLVSPISGINLRIWDGAPPDGAVVFGDTTTNRLLSTGWTGIYRVGDTGSGSLFASNRPVMFAVADISEVFPAGTYWIDWQVSGSGSDPFNGPHAVPITITGQTTTGDALGIDPFSGLWEPLWDEDWTSTYLPQGIPFIVEGTINPSCQTLTTPVVTGVGGAACGGTTSETSPVLTWSDVQNESSYRWELRDLFGSVLRSGSTGPDVTSVDLGSLPSGSYSARVQALGDGDDYCDSQWAELCPFEVAEGCEDLAVPVISSIGGASCGGSTSQAWPTLIWTDVANEDGYRWEVRDSFGLEINSGSTGRNDTEVSVGNLASGNYIARVQATGDGEDYCDSAWTSYCSFEVDDPCESLPAPTITAIGGTTCGGSTIDESPVVRWEDLADESQYAWELRDAFNTVIRNGSTNRDVTSVNLGPVESGNYSVRVRGVGDGVTYCDVGEWSSGCLFEVLEVEATFADFTWWPEQPKEGQRVRFADVSIGGPIEWSWDMGDGWTSTEQNPSHAFSSSGNFDVSMMCVFPVGTDTRIRIVNVSGVVRCGDSVCEENETAWSCPVDCSLDPGESGRAGGSDRRPTVPAAVGRLGGANGTVWMTEGWVLNAGNDSVPLIFEFTPRNTTEVLTAGPFDLEPDGGYYWENLVEDLFGVTGGGALWIDAPDPVHFLTRTFNKTPEGNYGQAIRGLRNRFTIGKGDGEVYLIGLRDDSRFRSNLIFQEVDGELVNLEVEVYSESGEMLSRSTVRVKPHSNITKLLGEFGGGDLESAYATVRVLDGEGRINVIGSIVDNITGDPTTVDPIHLDQVVVKHTDGEKVVDMSHHLVAVVAHTKGAQNSVWGTKFTVISPRGSASQQIRLVYVPEYDRYGDVGPRIELTTAIIGGRQLVWDDVLIDAFGLPRSAKTQGALHVYSPGKVFLSSRTYNRMPDGSTLGQNIKALSAGDLVNKANPGTIMGLSHRPGSRTNIGVAAYSEVDTLVELKFFTNFPAILQLGTVRRTVKARSHLQVGAVFEELGLSNAVLPSVSAFVKVRQGGSVYAYASVVDNASGDPTTIEATRN